MSYVVKHQINATNHECYKISMEKKIAIGWNDQKSWKTWVWDKTPGGGGKEADSWKEGMAQSWQEKKQLVLAKVADIC